MHPVGGTSLAMPPAVGSAAPAAEPEGRTARASRRAWVHLAPLVAALVALAALVVLAAGPWIVSRRLAALDRELVDATILARESVHGVETAMLLEVAERGDGVGPGAPVRRSPPSRFVAAARAREEAEEDALGALAPRLGGEVPGDVARLRYLAARWHAAPATKAELTPTAGGAAARAVVHAADVLAAAERLDTALAEREAWQRARTRALESWDVVIPAALVPILVVAIVSVSWTGGRMADLAEEAERSRLALARASERKVALLRGLTHDLKNTLVAAGGSASLLRDGIVGPLTPEQQDHVARIGRLIAQAVSAVGDSLEIARVEAGALPVSRHHVDVRPLLLEVASDYHAAARSAGVALNVELPEELPAVDTDPAHVARIIRDLLSNAIKYTPAGGRVWLRASARPALRGGTAGAWVAVEVCDTGPGVPIAFRERIFEEFFRTPAARATAPGAGVGLAMSRRVARVLGGDITVDGSDGQGAIFTLWLPRA